MELKFHTNLNKNECAMRLKDAIKEKFTLWKSQDVFGKIKGDNFSLRGSGDFGGDMYLNKKFRGRLESVSEGTNIIGNTTMATFHNILFVLVLICALSILWVNINNWWVSLLVIVFLFFFYFLSGDSNKFYIDFIKKTLDATQIN